jgi:hypothetical protein
MRVDKALKLMARKGSRVALHHKGFEPKNVPRQKGQISLGYYTNTKGKPKVQLPTKVQLRRKTTKCWKQRRWRYATKANRACVVDGMLEGGFVLPK